MHEGNVFILSVSLSVLRAIAFECFDTETFLIWLFLLIYLGQGWVSRSLGQGQVTGKIDYFDCWTPNSFSMTNLWYYYGHQSRAGSRIFRRGGVVPFWGVLASNVGTFQ